MDSLSFPCQFTVERYYSPAFQSLSVWLLRKHKKKKRKFGILQRIGADLAIVVLQVFFFFYFPPFSHQPNS